MLDLILSHHSKLHSICKTCTKKVSTRLNNRNICSGCDVAHYCSIDCQKKDWIANNHKLICGKKKTLEQDDQQNPKRSKHSEEYATLDTLPVNVINYILKFLDKRQDQINFKLLVQIFTKNEKLIKGLIRKIPFITHKDTPDVESIKKIRSFLSNFRDTKVTPEYIKEFFLSPKNKIRHHK